jgi:glutathione S-transferase
MSSEPIKLWYFPISARGEVSRMICKAGGLEIEDSPDASGEDLASYGSPSGLPILKHGELKINQSIAIQTYLASIAPKYANLTPKERAKDNQFMCINEDFISTCSPPIFTEAKDFTTQIPAATKLFGLLEGLVPESGFINGLEFPTAADFCVVHIFYGYMPIGAFAKHASFDLGKYPKAKALAERTKNAIGYDAATMTNAAFGV